MTYRWIVLFFRGLLSVAYSAALGGAVGFALTWSIWGAIVGAATVVAGIILIGMFGPRRTLSRMKARDIALEGDWRGLGKKVRFMEVSDPRDQIYVMKPFWGRVVVIVSRGCLERTDRTNVMQRVSQVREQAMSPELALHTWLEAMRTFLLSASGPELKRFTPVRALFYAARMALFKGYETLVGSSGIISKRRETWHVVRT